MSLTWVLLLSIVVHFMGYMVDYDWMLDTVGIVDLISVVDWLDVVLGVLPLDCLIQGVLDPITKILSFLGFSIHFLF